MDYKDIIDSIFVNKSRYKTITDKEKNDAYYLINKKLFLCKKDKKHLYVVSSFMNKKSKNIYNTPILDKESNNVSCSWLQHISVVFLKNEKSLPFEWYLKSQKIKIEKTDKSIPKADKDMIMEYDNLSDGDYNFLLQNFRDDLEYKIKILKRGE